MVDSCRFIFLLILALAGCMACQPRDKRMCAFYVICSALEFMSDCCCYYCPAVAVLHSYFVLYILFSFHFVSFERLLIYISSKKIFPLNGIRSRNSWTMTTGVGKQPNSLGSTDQIEILFSMSFNSFVFAETPHIPCGKASTQWNLYVHRTGHWHKHSASF